MRQCLTRSGAFLDEAIRPGNDLVARHGGVALPDYSGSAGRRTAASGAGPVGHSLRRNKSGRGRSSCRSAPASDSPRKGTAALIPRRYGRNRDRHTGTTAAIAGILPLHACPALGHGVDAEPPSLISAPCLPLESSKLLRATQGDSSARRRPAEQQHQLSIGSPFEGPSARQSQRWQATRSASGAR